MMLSVAAAVHNVVYLAVLTKAVRVAVVKVVLVLPFPCVADCSHVFRFCCVTEGQEI